MSKVFIEESTLTAIGDAIRGKDGSQELINPLNMAAAITNIPSGGGGEVDPIVLSGDCSNVCAGDIASTYLKLYGNTVSTEDITNAGNMFRGSTLEKIPFDINLKDNTNVDMGSMFHECHNLKDIPDITYKGTSYCDIGGMFNGCNILENAPYIYNAYPSDIDRMFQSCRYLRELPDDYFDTWNWSRISSYKYSSTGSFMYGCYSIRRYPKFPDIIESSIIASISYSLYYNMAFCCYSLDEIINLPVINGAAQTSNLFTESCAVNSRLKDLTFRTNEDGTAKVANWKSQTIDLSSYIGYSRDKAEILEYNSGITADKEVTDDTTYQALKNDPDWFTGDINYSRYNHDSAVNTINSLPDTSAYLAANGGTNTIKFKGAAGALTDGGAINTLTEEEIAVATAKGWTVSFV